MLAIEVAETDLWDEKNCVFVHVKPITLQLEHSLVSISKWESKWHKPYLNDLEHTDEEVKDYIRCMTINKNVPPETYYGLSPKNLKDIADYITDPMTATWFSEDEKKIASSSSTGKKVTSELIYYWMTALNIPQDFEKWHLNRLMTLIRVCNIENKGPQKMTEQQVTKTQAEINRERRKALKTKG